MACCPKKDKNICCPKNSFLDVPAVSLIATDCGQHGMALGIIEPTSTLHVRSSSMVTTLWPEDSSKNSATFIELNLNPVAWVWVLSDQSEHNTREDVTQ